MQYIALRCAACRISCKEAATQMLEPFMWARGTHPPKDCTAASDCMLSKEKVPVHPDTWAECNSNIRRAEWSRKVLKQTSITPPYKYKESL